MRNSVSIEEINLKKPLKENETCFFYSMGECLHVKRISDKCVVLNCKLYKSMYPIKKRSNNK